MMNADLAASSVKPSPQVDDTHLSNRRPNTNLGKDTDGSGKSTTLRTSADKEAIPAHFASLSIHLVFVSASLGCLIGASSLLALPMLSPGTIAAVFNGRSGDPSSSKSTLEKIVAPQLCLYLACWATFHLFEFLVTAKWNATRLMKDSFLLQNGWNYHAAHLFGILEFIIESLFFPNQKTSLSPLNYLGFFIMLLGQYLRSTAMIHASSNFSHIVAYDKRSDHTLVKTGLYSLVRHPSYTGFFAWAVGTQLLLANPVATLAFCGVLWDFFSKRIQNEEEHLISFFGDEYVEYKKKVASGIPFVK